MKMPQLAGCATRNTYATVYLRSACWRIRTERKLIVIFFFGGFNLIPAVSLPLFSLLVGVTMIVDGGTNFFVAHRLAVQSSGAKICAAPSGRNVAAVSLGTSTTWTLTGAVMRSLCILESRHHQRIARRLCNHVTTAAMLHQLVTRLRFFSFFFQKCSQCADNACAILMNRLVSSQSRRQCPLDSSRYGPEFHATTDFALKTKQLL